MIEKINQNEKVSVETLKSLEEKGKQVPPQRTSDKHKLYPARIYSFWFYVVDELNALKSECVAGGVGVGLEGTQWDEIREKVKIAIYEALAIAIFLLSVDANTYFLIILTEQLQSSSLISTSYIKFN